MPIQYWLLLSKREIASCMNALVFVSVLGSDVCRNINIIFSGWQRCNGWWQCVELRLWLTVCNFEQFVFEIQTEKNMNVFNRFEDNIFLAKFNYLQFCSQKIGIF